MLVYQLAGYYLMVQKIVNSLMKEIYYMLKRYATELIQQQIVGQVYNRYKSYQLNKTIVALEYQNISDSREVLNVSLKRCKVEKSNLLETIET